MRDRPSRLEQVSAQLMKSLAKRALKDPSRFDGKTVAYQYENTTTQNKINRQPRSSQSAALNSHSACKRRSHRF